MKRIRIGIMSKQFDVLPTLTIRWFISYEGTLKFDIGCSWLCFYAQTTNFRRDRLKELEMLQNEFRIKYNIK